TFDDRVSFVLTDKLEIKRIDFLDVVRDQIDGQAEDEEALFNAEFALMTGELGQLLPAVVEALGGELKQEATTEIHSAVTKSAAGDPPF
ncbi:MAG: recombination-associated protein RdgC, partial [Betaproteobacteria bacterium HGW-Betaproteobacteria-19]